ncbi:MAG: hypothetical protein O6929_13625 [candidate division NC10 bacterium]|nr:hypothetical protein [candidate division NC10 bacterium]
MTPEFKSGLIVGIIGALVAAVLGFLLAAVWDLWKEKRRLARERVRAVSILRSEIVSNLALLGHSREILTKDIEAAKANQEVPVPVHLLSSRAWEAIHLTGALSGLQPELANKLEQVWEIWGRACDLLFEAFVAGWERATGEVSKWQCVTTRA